MSNMKKEIIDLSDSKKTALSSFLGVGKVVDPKDLNIIHHPKILFYENLIDLSLLELFHQRFIFF